jgi:hypothetical protein
MGFWSWITGNSETAATQAANVARQWQTLLDNAAALADSNYAAYYSNMVGSYGPPPAAVQAALDDARAAFHAGGGGDFSAPNHYEELLSYAGDGVDFVYKEAATEGFVDGVATAPALIAGAAGSTLTGFFSGLPAWLKWAAGAALALFALRTLAHLGVRVPGAASRRRKKPS